MTKIIVVLDLTPVRICSNILWFRDQATVSINNLVLSRMFICVKIYRYLITLHIEATEFREHTSIAKFSYMKFWDFFYNLGHFRIEASCIKKSFLWYWAKNWRRHLLMTLWSKELELERFQVWILLGRTFFGRTKVILYK